MERERRERERERERGRDITVLILANIVRWHISHNSARTNIYPFLIALELMMLLNLSVWLPSCAAYTNNYYIVGQYFKDDYFGLIWLPVTRITTGKLWYVDTFQTVYLITTEYKPKTKGRICKAQSSFKDNWTELTL